MEHYQNICFIIDSVTENSHMVKTLSLHTHTNAHAFILNEERLESTIPTAIAKMGKTFCQKINVTKQSELSKVISQGIGYLQCLLWP